MATASEKEREIHQLILKGDDLALSMLYELYGESVVAKLKSLYRQIGRTDDAIIFEAVNEAFFGYYKRPMTFDPGKNTLRRFLEIAAERDLKNLLEKNKTRSHGKEKLLKDVELDAKSGNRPTEEERNPEFQVIYDHSMTEIEKELRTHFNTDEDVELAKLVLSKVRETEKYASILGIDELPDKEKRTIVKKNKDRIKAVIDRKNIEEAIKKLIYE